MSSDRQPVDLDVRWLQARRRFIRLGVIVTIASTILAGLLGYAISRHVGRALESGCVTFVAFATGMIVTYLTAKRRRARATKSSSGSKGAGGAV